MTEKEYNALIERYNKYLDDTFQLLRKNAQIVWSQQDRMARNFPTEEVNHG